MSVGHRIVLELLDPTLGLVAEDLGADILTEVVGRALIRDGDRVLTIDRHPAHGVYHLGHDIRHSALLSVRRSRREHVAHSQSEERE